MTGIVNCECSDGEGHGIAHNGSGIGEEWVFSNVKTGLITEAKL